MLASSHSASGPVGVASLTTAYAATISSAQSNSQLSSPSKAGPLTGDIQYADRFDGMDFGAKVNAAIAALPDRGGTVDARGLTGNQTWSTAIRLGSQTQPVTLLLGNATLNRASGVQLLVYNSSTVIGEPGTLVRGNDTTAGAIAQGPSASTNVSSVIISNLRIDDTSPANSGSIAVNLPSMINSVLRSIFISHVHTGLVIGGTGTCACYNSFYNIESQPDPSLSGAAGTTAVKFLATANQNQWFGGLMSDAVTGIYIDSFAVINEFFGPDFEHDFAAPIEIRASSDGNSFFGLYMENDGPILLDPGATANGFYGSGGAASVRNHSNWKCHSEFFQLHNCDTS
jgi:hypothetical protein